MDDLDRALVTLVRNQVPLSRYPYAEIARLSGSDEAQVLVRLNRLKRTGVFFQIRALWDSSRFGYKTTQAAMRFSDTGLVDFAADILTKHPAVHYVEKRPDETALWFKLSIPVCEQLNQHIDSLHRICGAQRTFVLPVRKSFKVRKDGVEQFSHQTGKECGDRRRQKPEELFSPEEICCIRSMQDEIPIVDDPFRQAALRTGFDEDVFFQTLLALKTKGFLKKIAAVVKKKSAADEAGCFKVLWDIPDERVEPAAGVMAGFPEVLECQKKPVYPDWPYSVYTDICADGLSDCEKTAEKIETAVGPWRRKIIAPAQVLKNTAVKYFSDDLQGWLQTNEISSNNSSASV